MATEHERKEEWSGYKHVGGVFPAVGALPGDRTWETVGVDELIPVSDLELRQGMGEAAWVQYVALRNPMR